VKSLENKSNAELAEYFKLLANQFDIDEMHETAKDYREAAKRIRHATEPRKNQTICEWAAGLSYDKMESLRNELYEIRIADCQTGHGALVLYDLKCSVSLQLALEKGIDND